MHLLFPISRKTQLFCWAEKVGGLGGRGGESVAFAEKTTSHGETR